MALIDLQFEYLHMLFDILLKDKNTGKNIIWCTNDYIKLGVGYSADCEITYESLVNLDSEFLQPRVTKSKEIQKCRTRDKAEVFTPSWLCKDMNNFCEKDWFEKHSKGFDLKENYITEKFLKSYVDVKKLEITCGEAPFVVSRYDTTTGNIIPLYERIGFLDRKLTAISDYTNDMDEWFEWVCRAYQSCYGYEYQGDNLFKARLNLIHTFLDYYEKKWVRGFPTNVQLKKISNIIMKNFWQMDGLTYTVPNTDIVCKVYNWRSKKNMNLVGEDNMKFDYIVGNPPYQENRENTSDKPIYNDFMDMSYKSGDKVLLVTPGRFLFNAGNTSKEWNKKMLSDKHFKVVKYYIDSKKVFNSIDIKGGVAIHYRDITKDFGEIGEFMLYEELNTILKKVVKDDFKSIVPIMYSHSSYRISEKIIKDYPELKETLKRFVFGSNAFDIIPNYIFIDEKEKKSNKDYICMYGRKDNSRVVKYIEKQYVIYPDNLNFYKVFIPNSNGCGSLGEVLSTPVMGVPVMGVPVMGSTETFISVGKFKTEKECENCLKYVKTKFARLMLGILKVTQHNGPDKWKYVPIQDFTENSDINWSVSISEIDKQLYKKYGLDEKEIAFIEEKVKEME